MGLFDELVQAEIHMYSLVMDPLVVILQILMIREIDHLRI